MIQILALLILCSPFSVSFCQQAQLEMVEKEEIIYNPVSLSQLALMKLPSNRSEDVEKNLQYIPASFLPNYIESLKKFAVSMRGRDRSPRMRQACSVRDGKAAKKSVRQLLQKLIDKSSFPLSRASAIYLPYLSKLERSTLTKRVLEAVKANEHLSEESMIVLARSFLNDPLVYDSFDDLLKAYGVNHPQKEQIRNALIKVYDQYYESMHQDNRLMMSCWELEKPESQFLKESSYKTRKLAKDDHDKVELIIGDGRVLTTQVRYNSDSIPPVAALSCDGELLALGQNHRINIYQFYRNVQDGESDCRKTRWMLSLCLPEDFRNTLLWIQFSTDNEWLKVINKKKKVIFYRLPLSFIRLSASLENLMLMMYVHQKNTNHSYNMDELSLLASILANSSLLKTIQATDRYYFIERVQELQRSLRNHRQAVVSKEAKWAPELMQTYFIPGETIFLKEDLLNIESRRLQKKLTKNIALYLKDTHPGPDYSLLTQVREETICADIKRNFSSALDTLALREKTAENFQKIFFAIAEKSYNRFAAYQ